jgi:6-phosphogluconolactonase
VPGSQPELHVVDDVAAAVGDLIAEQARRGGSIVLTGGSSVGEAYRRAAAQAPDWSRVSVWWGDERAVPPDDGRSNFKLTRETLLDRLAVDPCEVHRIRGEIGPAAAADELDGALDGVELDLLLLGLGPDGHIASLFPGSPQLSVSDRRATHGPAGLEPFVDRVTMTMPELQSAQRIVVVVAGDQKAEAVARSFGGEVSPDVPGSLLRFGHGTLEVYLDPPAAAQLQR